MPGPGRRRTGAATPAAPPPPPPAWPRRRPPARRRRPRRPGPCRSTGRRSPAGRVRVAGQPGHGVEVDLQPAHPLGDPVGGQHLGVDLAHRAHRLARRDRPAGPSGSGGARGPPRCRGSRRQAQRLGHGATRAPPPPRRRPPRATPSISRSSGSGVGGRRRGGTRGRSPTGRRRCCGGRVGGQGLDQPGSSDVRSTDSSATSGLVISMPSSGRPAAGEVAGARNGSGMASARPRPTSSAAAGAPAGGSVSRPAGPTAAACLPIRL